MKMRPETAALICLRGHSKPFPNAFIFVSFKKKDLENTVRLYQIMLNFEPLSLSP